MWEKCCKYLSSLNICLVEVEENIANICLLPELLCGIWTVRRTEGNIWSRRVEERAAILPQAMLCYAAMLWWSCHQKIQPHHLESALLHSFVMLSFGFFRKGQVYRVLTKYTFMEGLEIGHFKHYFVEFCYDKKFTHFLTICQKNPQHDFMKGGGMTVNGHL